MKKARVAKTSKCIKSKCLSRSSKVYPFKLMLCTSVNFPRVAFVNRSRSSVTLHRLQMRSLNRTAFLAKRLNTTPSVYDEEQDSCGCFDRIIFKKSDRLLVSISTACLMLLYFALLLSLLRSTLAVKFDLPGTASGNEYCLSQYIAKDMLCTTVVDITGGDASQSMALIVRDKSPSSNQFYSKPETVGNTKFAFKTHEWADVEFCFTNTLPPGMYLNERFNIVFRRET
jgi:hypothetical protein